VGAERRKKKADVRSISVRRGNHDNKRVGAAHLMELVESGKSHLTDDEMAGYVDRSLAAGERERVEGHLADCSECRAEMRVAANLIRAQKQRKLWYWGSSTVAAAAAVILLVVGPFSRTASEEPTLRAPGATLDAGIRAISAVTPQSGATVDRDDLTFVWESVGADVNYRFTLTNVLGEEIWQADVGDTSVVLSAEITLVPGEVYVWLVDALLLDGRSVTTGSQSFQLNR
jgi:hypothetical protein